MNDELQTEEKGKKIRFNFSNFLPFIIGIIIVLVVVIIIVLIVSSVDKKKQKTKKEDDVQSQSAINSELSGVYAFAKEDNYIVALIKNKGSKKIYNLSQGTGNLGAFHDFYYHNNKIYILFGASNIYSLSLTDGNGVYELNQELEYKPLSCKDSAVGNTSNIIVTDDIIYFNNSSCGVSGYNYSEDGYLEQVDLYQFDKVLASSMYYEDGILYFQGNNAIFKLDEDEGEIVKLFDGASGDIDLDITDDVLLYAQKNQENTYNYFGYNVSSNMSGALVEKAKGMLIYNEKYIYYDNTGVYIIDGDNINQIYKTRYNELSNMQLIDNYLQIVDKSTIGDDKKRVYNIDLKNEYKKRVVNDEYSLIRLFSE